MIKSSLTKFGFIEAATKFKEDSLDTMNKIGAVVPLFIETADSVHDDIVDSDVIEEVIPNLPLTILCDDGDVISLTYDSQNLSINSNIYDELGQLVSSTEVFKKVGESYLVINNQITAINGEIWTLNEVAESLLQSYSVNDLVQRACSLAEQGQLTQSNFAAVCSDMSSNLNGQVRELYNNIMQNIDGNNVGRLIHVLGKLVQGAFSNEVHDQTIDFSPNEYFVSAYVGTIIKDVIVLAIQAIGIVLQAMGYGIGLAIALGGSAVSSVIGLINQKTDDEATVNNDAYEYTYQQPLIQDSVQIWNAGNQNRQMTKLWRYMLEHKLLKVTTMGMTMYLWTDGVQTEGTTITVNYEVFANYNVYPRGVSRYPEVLSPLRMVPGYSIGYTSLQEDAIYVYSNIGTETGDSNYDKLTNWAMRDDTINCVEAIDPSQTYTDAELRFRLMQSLIQCFFYLTIGSQNNDTASLSISSSYNWNSVQNKYDVMRGLLITTMRVEYSWELIVNTIIPKFNQYCKFTNSGLSSFLDLVMNYTYVDQETGVTLRKMAGISNYSNTFVSKGIGYVVPPKYSKNAFWISVAIGALAATAALAAYFVGRTLVRKATSRIMYKKYARVQNLQAIAQADPTDTNVKAYQRQVRKYNLVARLLGQSTLNPISGWLEESNHASTADTLLSNLKKYQDEGFGSTAESEGDLLAGQTAISDDINVVKNLIKHV